MCRLLTSGCAAHVSARMPPHHPVPMTATPICFIAGSSRRLTARTLPWLHLRTVSSDPIRFDFHDQPFLAGASEGVLVGAEEALGELVDVRVGAGLGHGRGA